MTDASTLRDASWPAADLGAAVTSLVRAAGLVVAPGEAPGGPQEGEDAAWIADAAARLGVEIVAVTVRLGEMGDMLRRLGPAMFRLPGDGRFILVLRSGSRRLRVLAPDARVAEIERREFEEALGAGILAPAERAARVALTGLGLAADDRVVRAFARERVGEATISGCWLVRPSPASPLLVQLRAGHAPLLLALVFVARAGATGLLLMLWWLVGRDVLSGDLARASLGLWAMCLLSAVPLRVLDEWAQHRLALTASVNLKEALLLGILHLERGAMRSRGVGQFMGMTMEGEIAANAGKTTLAVLAAAIELVTAMLVLALGATGAVHVALLAGWLAVTVWLIRRYVRQATRWTAVDRELTNDLVERLVGYQTRLVQERSTRRHADEDVLLQGYLTSSQVLDRRSLALGGLVRPGWLLLGVGVLAPALLSGSVSSPAIAVAIGGVLMVGRALEQVVQGVVSLADVWSSWQQVGPILQQGRRGCAREAEVHAALSQRHAARPGAPLLRFTDLSLRHGAERPEVLRSCTQEIHAGDRVLLEGPSGGGKSSLAAVLAGLHAPDRGTLWLRGEPCRALPPEHWRGQVVLVPQFHDNHLLTDTLLFNLLLGRGWPPTADDAAAAEAMCERLGLGPLLKRMPQGLGQTVGEGGWALSHGERSRVFLARAMLQRDVALAIFDESFAALDPETLRVVYRGVLEVAPTLLVIAHP